MEQKRDRHRIDLAASHPVPQLFSLLVLSGSVHRAPYKIHFPTI